MSLTEINMLLWLTACLYCYCMVHFFFKDYYKTRCCFISPGINWLISSLLPCRLRQTCWHQITSQTEKVELIWWSLTPKGCLAGSPHGESSSLTSWQVMSALGCLIAPPPVLSPPAPALLIWRLFNMVQSQRSFWATNEKPGEAHQVESLLGSPTPLSACLLATRSSSPLPSTTLVPAASLDASF